MKSTSRLSAVAALAVSLAAASVGAQPALDEPNAVASPETDRRDGSSVSAVMGVFAPTGTVGIEYAQVFHRHLEVGLGAGLGYVIIAAHQAGNEDPTYSVAPQFSLMPRARMRRGPLKLTAGAGVSLDTGMQESTSPFSGSTFVDRYVALWANAEVGAQLVSKAGWFAGAFLGYAVVAAASEGDKKPGSDPDHMPDDPTGDNVPYLGVRFGRTL